jgi:hypothetical protein
VRFFRAASLVSCFHGWIGCQMSSLINLILKKANGLPTAPFMDREKVTKKGSAQVGLH